MRDVVAFWIEVSEIIKSEEFLSMTITKLVNTFPINLT